MPLASFIQPHSPEQESPTLPSTSKRGSRSSEAGTRRRVTQLDVANAAGVHNTTVSLALRNHPSIPQETRQRIRAIADQLGYRPDPTLQALVAYRKNVSLGHKTETIAYVSTARDVSKSWSEGAAQLYHSAATRKATELGYHLEHFALPASGISPQRLRQMLFHRGIRGVIFQGDTASALSALESDTEAMIGVMIGTASTETTLPHVRSNWTGGLRLAIKRCLAAGYQKPALFIPASFDAGTKRDLAVHFLADLSLQVSADQLPIYFEGGSTGAATTPNLDRAAPQEAVMFRSWFKQLRPDVILGPHSLINSLLNAAGFSAPGQTALVDPFAIDPPADIAAVAHSPDIVATLAIETLANRLQQNLPFSSDHAVTILVDGRWQEGASLPHKATRRSGK